MSTEQDATASETPVQEEAPRLAFLPETFDARLICGIPSGPDEVVDTVKVRELIGPDRDVLGMRETRSNAAKMVTALLANNVVDVPGIELPAGPPADPRLRPEWSRRSKRQWGERLDHFASWPGADRDAVLVALRRRSLGDVVRGQRMSCAEIGCEHRWTQDFDMSEWGPTALDREFWRLRGSPPRWMAELTADVGGRTVTALFRMPTGEDDEAVSAQSAGNLSQAARIIFERGLLKLNGEPVSRRDMLPVRVQDALWEGLRDRLPGVGIPIRFACPRCGGDVLTRLGAFSLLYDVDRGD